MWTEANRAIGVDVERVRGVLLGTALGDALGLPAEGMRADAIARRWGRVDRFHILGRTGIVSDDTEQAALVAESLLRHPEDADACAAAFRRALVAWFLRLPWGVGLATVRACLRSAAGMRPSGVRSAGNGAAMRAAVIGVHFADLPEERRRFGRAVAEVTHTDARAVEGALFVAELAAACAAASPGGNLRPLVSMALDVVNELTLREALQHSVRLAEAETGLADAASALGTSGYVVHTVPFALFCFLRDGDKPLTALTQAISAGGDTDSIAAILGGWLGALHGERGLPLDLVNRIHDGPFGPTHLRALAVALAASRHEAPAGVPGYSRTAALVRNAGMVVVVLGHGFRRLIWRH